MSSDEGSSVDDDDVASFSHIHDRPLHSEHAGGGSDGLGDLPILKFGQMEPMGILDSGSGNDRESAKQPHRLTEWYMVIFLLLGDIIGTGVLELPIAMKKLGWLFGLLAIAFFSLPNLYTGHLLATLRHQHPRAVSYGDLAKEVLGPRFAVGVWVLMYFNFILLCGSYLLVLARTLQGLCYEIAICQPVWAFIACLCLLPSNQLRTLNAVSITTVVGFATMIITLFVCLVQAVQVSPGTAVVGVVQLNTQGSGWQYFEALSGIVFAYSGQGIYLEMMAEMKEPKKFTKALNRSTVCLTLVYITVALVVYTQLGDLTPAFLPDLLPYNMARILANLPLFIHMLVSYTITQQILCRALMLTIAPAHANVQTTRARLIWFGITTSVLVFSWLIACAIPFFDDLTGICGALLGATISFALPCIFTLAQYRQRGWTGMTSLTGVLLVIIITCSVLFTVLGLTSNVKDIVSKTESAGAFACRCTAPACVTPN